MTGPVQAAVSKLLAVGLLMAVLWAFTILVLKPVAEMHGDVEAGIEAERALLGRLQSAIAEAQAARPETPASVDRGPVFLTGGRDASRIATLQSMLAEEAAAIGTRLTSTQAVPGHDVAGVRLTGVQTQLSTSIDKLQRFIHAIETARPPLFVDKLNISRGPERDGQDVTELDVRLVVLGATPRQTGEAP